MSKIPVNAIDEDEKPSRGAPQPVDGSPTIDELEEMHPHLEEYHIKIGEYHGRLKNKLRSARKKIALHEETYQKIRDAVDSHAGGIPVTGDDEPVQF